MNPLENESWDTKAVHEHFLRAATEKDRYLSEVRNKVKSGQAYESIYDQTLAEFYVYNFFHGRTHLSSREAFLDALGDLEVAAVPHDDYFDRTRFAQTRLIVIRHLQTAASIRS